MSNLPPLLDEEPRNEPPKKRKEPRKPGAQPGNQLAKKAYPRKNKIVFLVTDPELTQYKHQAAKAGVTVNMLIRKMLDKRYGSPML